MIGFTRKALSIKNDMRKGWLISYLAVFCVPLFAYILMSCAVMGIIREQTYTLNQNTLNIAASAIDYQVQSAEMTAAEIIANEKLASLIKAQQDTSPAAEYKIVEIQNTLRMAVSRNGIIDAIYVYMNEGDYVLSNTTKAKPEFYFENELSSLAMSVQEWKKIMTQPHVKDYATWENQNGSSTMVLMISQNIYENAPKATICIVFNTAKFWQVMNEKKDMQIEVYDMRNEKVYWGNGKTRANPVVLASQNIGWRYEAYIEDAVISAQEGYALLLILGGILLAGVVSAVLIWGLIKRNYNPIRDIVSKFEQYFEKRSDNTGEITYIESSLNQLVERLQENRAEMREKIELMDQAYLICLLLGQRPKDISVQEELRAQGFEEKTNYRVLILSVPQEVTAKEAEEALGIGQQETCLFFGRSVELDGRIVFVVDADSGNEESMNRVQERLLEQYSKGRLAWSVPYAGGENLCFAYEEAQYILDSASESSCGVLTLARLLQEQAGHPLLPAELTAELACGVQNEDLEQVIQSVDKIQKYNEKGMTLPLFNAKVLAVSLYNYVLNIKESHQNSGEELQTLHNIQMRAQSTEEVWNYLHTALRKMTAGDSGGEMNRNRQLVNKMKSYIDVHYGDELLSVDSLCRAFDRSPSGVNKAFREVMGHGPLNYINYRRIQEAKRIFAESGGEVSASEVLKQVGYSNLNTFTRAFKRNEGITPGQFKDAVQQARQKFDHRGV